MFYEKFRALGVHLRKHLDDATRKMVIYVAINETNGKCYIGATKNSFARRKYQHELAAKAKRDSSPVFHRAIRKYGSDNFRWFVLAQRDSIDDLISAEIEFIEKLRPEYNVTKGGRGLIGAPRTPEWRANQSRGLMGRVSPKTWLGKKFSAQHRANMSKGKKGIRPEASLAALEKHRQHALHVAAIKFGRPVMCLEDGLHFLCLGFANKHYQLGLTSRDVNNALRVVRREKPVCGKRFVFVDKGQHAPAR